MPQCRSYQAEIRWERQKSGKMMPVNPKAEYMGEKRYEPGTSHFATCPNTADDRQEARRGYPTSDGGPAGTAHRRASRG